MQSSPPMVLDAGAVAGLLNRRESWFRNRRAELERNGFPAKLPGLNGWSRPAVERWIETNGATYLPADLIEEEDAA